MADLTPNDNLKPISGGGGGGGSGGGSGSASQPDTSTDAGGSTRGNAQFPAAAGSHKPAGHWHRRLQTMRRWARDTFNREQFVAGFKQLLWVAPLTLLIWVYAEREQQVDDTIRVTIDAHSSDPKTTVRLLDPPDGSVLMNIKGPRSRIDELHRTLESRPTPVRVEVPPGLPPTQRLLEVKQAVQNDSRFTGVSVSGSQPPRVNVEVDRLEERGVPVQLRPQDRANFEQPVFTPSEVKVRVPAKTLEGPLKNNLTVYADLSNFPDMSPGLKSDVRGIPLKLDKAEGLPDVTVEPSTVSVSLTVRQRNSSITLNQPLFIREEDDSPLLRNAARITFDPNMYQVKLQGPPDALAMIEKNPDSVRAVITLTRDELQQGGSVSKEIRFDLPPGVKFVSSKDVAEGQPAKVEVKIEKGSAVE
jgi:hypothetical protein